MNTRLLPMVCFVFCAWAGFCDSGKLPVRDRRILYNLDGDSCMTLKSGRKGPGPITLADLTNIVAGLTGPRSQVDTLLVCVNAQVMYYPTKVGTMRGGLSKCWTRRG